MNNIKIIDKDTIQSISYTGQLRFQERGQNRRRYLQQQRKVDTIDGIGLVTRYDYEDVPLVDEQGNTIQAKMSEPRS